MLDRARQHGYMIPYTESWNLESIQAVIEAAEECESPIISGFNGGFLRHSLREKPENLAYYACFREALEKAKVPAAFLLNESDSLQQMEEAIDLGFNAVMPENEGLSLIEYEELVRAVVRAAKPRGVWVEAQIGSLPMGGVAGSNGHGEPTDPERAERFVAATGIDALAVAVGNVHILTNGKVGLDLDLIRRIHRRVTIPLVIHGGTGIASESYTGLVEAGVAKVNFGTGLKQEYLEAVQRGVAVYRRTLSPHEFLGMGGTDDVMIAGRTAVKREVMRLIALCGSNGRCKDDHAAGIRERSN